MDAGFGDSVVNLKTHDFPCAPSFQTFGLIFWGYKKMKHLICVAALMVVGTQTFADDGKLSQIDLNAFGLSGIQLVSDAEGMTVRGTASWAGAPGWTESDIDRSPHSSEDAYSFNEYDAFAENNNDSEAAGGSESFSAESWVDSGSINYQGGSDIIVDWTLSDTFTIGSGGGAGAQAN